MEYQDTGRGWSVWSRNLDIIEPLGPIFATLTGEVALTDAGHGTVDGRPARDLRAPWKPLDIQIEERLSGGGISERRTMPGGPIPADAAQHLWIDERTLLPLRWAITMTPPPAAAAPAAPLDYGMFFVLDPSIELRPPDGVPAPACVP